MAKEPNKSCPMLGDALNREVKGHIYQQMDNPAYEFRKITEFVRAAVREKMEREKAENLVATPKAMIG